MSIIEQIREKAARRCPTLVLPESTDLRVMQAAIEVERQGIAQPVLLGDKNELDALAKAHQLDIVGLSVFDVPQLAESAELHQYLRSRKWYADLSESELVGVLSDPLALACAMLAVGQVDICVAGAVFSTAEVISRGLRIVGVSEESPLLSCFFLVVFKSPPADGLEYALFSDCAINVNPESEQLAQIAISTAESARTLFEMDPKVALLSFSSAGSANHPDARKVADAKALIHAKAPSLSVIGETQFDAALLPSIRESKIPDAPFQTPANVYIFPNLDAGNIGYKIAERIGRAKVIGPILQGMRLPLNDLSRGSDVETIVNTIAMTCLQIK